MFSYTESSLRIEKRHYEWHALPELPRDKRASCLQYLNNHHWHEKDRLMQFTQANSILQELYGLKGLPPFPNSLDESDAVLHMELYKLRLQRYGDFIQHFNKAKDLNNTWADIFYRQVQQVQQKLTLANQPKNNREDRDLTQLGQSVTQGFDVIVKTYPCLQKNQDTGFQQQLERQKKLVKNLEDSIVFFDAQNYCWDRLMNKILGIKNLFS